MDAIKIAIIITLAAGLLATLCAAFVAWENSGSRNLALATSALVATLLAYGTQLLFELRGSETQDWIATDFTIDHSKPSIRQWEYSGDSGRRILAETDASNWLAANNRAAFSQNQEKLTSDFLLRSVVSFFTNHEYDWQLSTDTYSVKKRYTVTIMNPGSKREECTILTEADLRSRLSKAGNLFAESPLRLSSGQLCLPPRTHLEISEKILRITNPICELDFEVTLPGAVMHTEPGSGGQVPLLSGGGPRFETRPLCLKIATRFFGLRSQHRDRGKYQEWSSRVIRGLKQWFES